MPPNVLMCVFDTARADAFEPWGAADGASPTVSDLASRGTAFPLVVAPSNWTLPSHASMFTGLLPGALGLTSGTKIGTRAGVNSRPLLEANADRVLAEVLRRRGYDTRAVSANPWVHEVNGFATGFEEFRSIRGERRHPGPGLRSRMAWLLDVWRARADDGAAQAERIVGRWLRERDDRPFFWFVNLMECHSPYLPPRPYDGLSRPARLRAARAGARVGTPEGIYRVSVGDLDVDDDTMATLRDLYAGAIRQMDDWLARMLGALEASGLLADTIVVVTSDHGENLGENHLIGHVLSMDDRLIRVPLVVAGPGCPATRDIVSLAELPGMLGGPLGLDPSPWSDDVRPGGYAVSQVAGQFLMPERETLARAWGVPQEAIRRIASPMTAATDGRFKLVRSSDGEHLYDLVADRLEVRPLDPGGDAAKDAPVPGLRAALDAVEAMTPQVVPTEAPPADAESAELEERLRQLGYI